MQHPIEGIPICAANFPARMRVVDVARSLRINGYVLVIQRGQLLAVRIH